MFQTQMIQQIIEWERRLEIENEKRKNYRIEAFSDFPVDLPPYREERESIFARILKRIRKRPAADACYAQDHCRESLPG